MNPIELTGTIVSIGEEIRKSDRFSIRQFSIEIGDDRHPNIIPCDLFTDDMDMIDPYIEGQSVVLQVYLRGWARGVNIRCVGIQPVDKASNYKPHKEPELPPFDGQHYADGETIPFGRNHIESPSPPPDKPIEGGNDLPF